MPDENPRSSQILLAKGNQPAHFHPVKTSLSQRKSRPVADQRFASMRSLLQAGLCLAFMLSGPTCGAAADRVVEVMDSIVIPRVSLEKVSLEEAVDWARFRAMEVDPAPAPYKGAVNITCISPKNKKPDTETGVPGDPQTDDLGSRTITYAADKVTLTALLIEFAKQAQLDLHITTVAIVFCGPGRQPDTDDNPKYNKIVRTLYKVPAKAPKKPVPNPKAKKAVEATAIGPADGSESTPPPPHL